MRRPDPTRLLLFVATFASATLFAGVTGLQTQASPQMPGGRTAPVSRRDTGASPATTPALSPRNASYSINAHLDPRSRTLTGSEIVTWRNISRVSASDLQFHLYYNAWRNTQSTWMRERAWRRPSQPEYRELVGRPADQWGWIDVTAIRLLGQGAATPIDLRSQARFVAPDDGNEEDRTVMSVPLPEPVSPGETVNVQLEWVSRVPRTVDRTGAIGSFFFLAQWFPKIGVLEDSGWNCHQFHTATEFFADYGIYDVRITIPQAWVVGATGVERESPRNNADGTTLHHYYQEDVHDFAWTTSPDYVERREQFEHPTLPAVAMRLLLQPEHLAQADRHFAATRAALRYYGEWYGPYPYGHLTIVDPAWQSRAGGMEYPTLFTAGTRWIAPEEVAGPESVTIHEAGHQFWYGIVGNNEFEHALLDEGFNQFSEARLVGEVYGPTFYSQRYFGDFIPWVFRDIPLSRATGATNWARYRLAAKSNEQSIPTFRYWVSDAGAITYDKTALWLATLERYLGWPTLQRILSTYFNRWKFKHPRPEDFFAVANEVSGTDLTWFFDQVYRSSNSFDYGIQELTTAPDRVRGFIERDGRLQFEPGMTRRGGFHSQVVVRRYGEAIFPVDVLIAFENGDKIRERWDGRDRWKMYTYDRPAPIAYAVVDPDRVLALDVDLTNNSKSLKPRREDASRRWMLSWMVWLEDLMLTYAFFV